MNAQRAGFIGLGRMGRHMAMRLLEAAVPLTVFNRSADKLEPFRAAGAAVAASPAGVAAASGIVFLCLSDGEAVENVVFGSEGVAAGGTAGKLLVDCSSIPPAATREMARRLRETCGMGWVDAPVSGGVPGAEQGTLIFMCGGEAADVEEAGPLFALLGRRATHMGPVGSGQMAKLCNQAIVSSNLAVIAEAMNLARAAGVNVARLPEALGGGFADSLPLQIYGPRMAGVLEGEAMGDINTMLKDVDNVLAQARAASAPMPVSAAAADRYRLLADRGFGNEDLDRLMRLFDSESAVDTATREALEDLLTEFARLVDNGLGDRVHALFTEDGTITGPGLAMTSRAEIAEQFAARAGDLRRLSRHLWSNPRFDRLDEDTVRVTTVVQTYMHLREEGEEEPAARHTLVVGDSADIIRRCEDGRWRFASRQLHVVFRSEP